MGIYAQTKFPEQAGKFFDFFFNTEEAARLLHTVRSVPPTAMAQQLVTNAGLLNKLTADGVAKSITYNGQTDSGLTTSAESKKILDDAYEAIAYGSTSPAALARTVVQQYNAFLARQ
jgi:oligogalacturonide transport system substrate-binding protein